MVGFAYLRPKLVPVPDTRSLRPRRADENYGQRDDFFEYILSVPAPRVVVIEDVDEPSGVGSYWGEMHATQHQALACVGSVTNGCVRDLDEVEQIGFHLFSQFLGVSHAYCHIVEFDKPVKIGGLEIRSGDLLHGDKHDVHKIPLEIATYLPEACRKRRESEFDFIDFYRSPDFTLDKMRERMKRS
jgi:regulator of RNase E activity RraA